MPEKQESPGAVTAATEAQKNGEASDSGTWSDWEALFARSMDVFTYSRKSWYTHRRAKVAHGNPLTPREPGYFGPGIRMAARMCDLANSGMTDGRYGPRRRGRAYAHMSLDELARASAGFGVEETEAEKAARNGIATDQWHELTAYGADAILDLAKLTAAERHVWRLIADGRVEFQISMATGKAPGTVRALRQRGLGKLRGLRAEVAA